MSSALHDLSTILWYRVAIVTNDLATAGPACGPNISGKHLAIIIPEAVF
jgi:hypothetical protein